MSLIISLSSIPPRFEMLEKGLYSLLAQAHPADEIRLYIPCAYRRFPDWDGALPDVPSGITIYRTAVDFGPATKVLPAVQDLAGTSTEILFCDDDRVYDPLWTTRFLEQRRNNPDCAIAECGQELGHLRISKHRHVPRAERIHKGIKYRALRVLTLGSYKPHSWVKSGYVDVAEGYGGIMIRPEFLPAEAFDIPDILWTVDDFWLSGCMEKHGIGIWLNADAKMSAGNDAGGFHPLTTFRLGNVGRKEANAAAVAWFQKNNGIW